MIKVKVADLLFDEISQMGIVLLEEDVQSNESSIKPEDVKIIPIWIGMFEAQSIMFKLQNMFFPRPLTHDLLKNCIEALSGKIEYIVITAIKDNTFYAEIHIRLNEKEVVVDSRPSDAIALAIRCECPIYVNEEVMNLSSVRKEDFIREQKDKVLRQILELVDTDEDNKLKH